MVVSVHRMIEQPPTQAQDHDHRIGWLEGIAEQLDRRLDSIEKKSGLMALDAPLASCVPN